MIATIDGKVITGRIVNLHNDGLALNTDMLDPSRMITVRRGQIEEMKASPVSMMPDGLLDTLNREEILDLIAYLLSRGDRENAMFQRRRLGGSMIPGEPFHGHSLDRVVRPARSARSGRGGPRSGTLVIDGGGQNPAAVRRSWPWPAARTPSSC